MRLGRALTGVAGVATACVAYGTLVERRWYRVRHQPVPGALNRPGRLRILHLSDLHLVPGQDHRVDFLAQLADLDYDLVVVTGDLLGAVGAEHLAAGALAPLTARGRTGLVVLGSNDLYAPVFKLPWSYFIGGEEAPRIGRRLDTDLLVDRLAAVGYRTLRDEVGSVSTPAGTVSFAGFDDPHLPTTRIPPADRLRAPAGVDALIHLGIVHAPYLAALDALVDADAELLLCGHTHGGQVRLPGVGALVANCDLPLDQARGLSRYRDRWLHVSVGLGHSRFAPFRFACRPEATVLELTA